MKNLLLKIKKAYTNEYLRIGSVFLLLLAYFGWIYFSINSLASLDDPLFHIRFAEIIKQQGMGAFSNFHWLYFSKISLSQSYFIYYNFLFYLVLLPFTFFSSLIFAIKLYGVIFAALVFAILYWFFLKIKIKLPFFWLMLLMSVMNFGVIWRFLMMRPFTFAPALLIIELYLLYKKKYIAIFLVSLLYFYWHTATFFLPLIIAVLFMLFENFYGKKVNWKLSLVSLLGVCLALAGAIFFVPGFFLYMKDIIFGVFSDTIIGKSVNIAEGGELYPVDFIDFIKTNTIIIGMLILAVVFEIHRYILEKRKAFSEFNMVDEGMRPLKGTLFFLSVAFLLGNFLSRRNGDFFVFFSAAYIAISFDYFVGFVQITSPAIKKSFVVGMIILIFYLFSSNGLILNNQIASAGSYESFKGATEWLKKNTNEGDIVFNVTWNWFPALFYYDTRNYYVAGIEPRFLYDYNHELYWKWWHASVDGFLCAQEKCDNLKNEQKEYLKDKDKEKIWYEKEGNVVSDTILNDFKSHYIITSKDFMNINTLMDNNGRFEKVYADNVFNIFIYKVK